jgi:hypothetical protein
VNEGLFADLQEILSYLQVNIGFNGKTLVKVIRVLKATLKHNHVHRIEWHKLINFKKIIKELIQLYLLPAATIDQLNCSVAFEMHDLLMDFTQEDRF